MELRFVKSESTFSYFEALERYLTTHGRPVAFYSDKHTVFRVPKPSEHMTGMTQFGRALAELQIEILCANTSQAKGRVERANRTLQDRLVKELRIAGISDMKAANAFLGLSRRQVHRLLKTFRADGPAAIRHKARGRPSNNRIDPAVREFALTLIRERYAGFGPTFAAEKLAEDHGLKVSRETLRKWMQDAGIWLSRKQRRTFHQPRRRRDCYGELVQIDGSDHAWFEERGPACTLLAFVDDATRLRPSRWCNFPDGLRS